MLKGMREGRTGQGRNLLALFLVSVFLAVPGGAFAGAKLSFTYPAGVSQSDVAVKVYKGFPNSSGIQNSLNGMTEILPAGGVYDIDAAGSYTYFVSGSGYYSVAKMFNVSAADVAAENSV